MSCSFVEMRGLLVSGPRDRVEMTQWQTRPDWKTFTWMEKYFTTSSCLRSDHHMSLPLLSPCTCSVPPSLSLCPRAFLFNFHSWDPEFAQIRLRASGGGLQIFASWLWIDFFLWSCRSEVVLRRGGHRASKVGSRRFHNHGEGTCKGHRWKRS